MLRQVLDIEVFTQGGNLKLRGDDGDVEEAQRRIEHLLGKLRKGRTLEASEIEVILAGPREGEVPKPKSAGPSSATESVAIGTPGERAWRPRGAEPARGEAQKIVLRPRAVEARSPNQKRYLDAIAENSLTFGVGVSGTGKTYLAVAAAVRRLRAGEVKRLVITRPVVEAGEHLGFLPGDLQAKLNPYMRPVYDALYDLIGFEDANRLEEAGVIEVAPLAFMRGRTLAQAFVILDEAQNTTVAQMKMFLTRLGEGSCMAVSGDPTQTDLEDPGRSGLLDAVRRLRGYAGVAVVEFSMKDIVRHPLVEQIVRAYEAPLVPPGPAHKK
ncbi:MAG: PhoH family protein [Planctomycetes bacterium]|nr:PhoH family protein [Planctomycetota bacterium]